MTCPVCKGRGEVALLVKQGAAYEKRVMVCPECEGSGERDAEPAEDERERL